MRSLLFIFVLVSFSKISAGQTLSSLRSKSISLKQDTVILDSLSIAPGTLFIRAGENLLDTSAFSLDFANAKIIWKKNSVSYNQLNSDSVRATYRVFSFLFGKEFKHKSTDLISRGGGTLPTYYEAGSGLPELFKMQGLSRSGSISRGITFGNNQDVFVNSSLNLQLAGKLSDNVEILAAITDENIPIQPEGNTQQLQDFDKVFIQLSNKRNKLIAGDFELKRPDSYFMNFYKKGQGGLFTTEIPLLGNDTVGKRRLLRSGISLAVSKGKFSKYTLPVKEGNQGPYKLPGNNGEIFIVVLSGTEKIYLDGELLLRGSQNDYVIDYNTAEVTFMAKRLITKDSRITAEFEYSDKNYARSLIFLNNEFESNKLKIKFNLYSEQDSKNQPLSLDLDSSRKAVMANAGDSLQNAVFPTADSIAFNANIVLYQKKDTTTSSGTFSIYQYSTNKDSAYWQVSFSVVGYNRGDYVVDLSSANGRVFKWLEPVGGIPQGNYAPVALLITPKKQQLIVSGFDYTFNNRNSIKVEGAYSNYDINLFSKKDKADNVGYAARVLYKNEVPLSGDTIKGWKLLNRFEYEYSGKFFRPIERFRNVEFERDWNLGTTSILNDEHIGSYQVSFLKPSLATFSYQLKSFNKGSAYKGLLNAVNSDFKWNKFSITGDGSFLSTQGLNTETRYLRHSVNISRPLWILLLGLREISEKNRFLNRSGDSLLGNSFAFNEFQGYINTLDTAKSKASISYKRREDRLASANKLIPVTQSEEARLTTEFSKNRNNTFRTITTYRVLTVKDSILSRQEPDKILLNRIDHTLNIWRGILSFNTYYEVGKGQERRQEYYYLRVNDGQGVYAYIGDENNNGVEDLNEFAISAFQDKANYIRIYVPTNEYISTRSNQFNEVLVISPAGNQSSYQGKEPFIHRFSNQLSARLERKTKNESLVSSLNPFKSDLSDTLLISSATGIRNTLYFNRTHSVFGLDLTWQENRNKAFLSNGFETRIQRSRIVNVRWNINRLLLATINYENGDRINQSEFFSGRDYTIFSNNIEPKISIQPNTNFRISASYKYGDKRNAEGLINERAISSKINFEVKYTSVNSGNFLAKVSLININYNASDASFLSYEMLDGFKNGKNSTWGLSMQRNLNNSMQLSLTYDGRKLKDSPVVHTGGVQFRAYF